MKVFGTPTPGPDANPMVRSTAVLHWKKCISSFMCDRRSQWSTHREEGNPTRSDPINDLVSYIKRKEVRQEGAPSQARRPCKEGEVRQILAFFGENPYCGDIKKFGIPGLVVFQLHMIGRLDDSLRLLKTMLQEHDLYPELALQCHKECEGTGTCAGANHIGRT